MDAKGSAADSSLLVEVRDRIAIATLNRPAARNALNQDLLSHFAQFMIDVDDDDEVDVVVLTGADPVFCAGLDLRELENGKGFQLGKLSTEGRPWRRCQKPLVGAINGAAVTGGLELALTCDFLVASERARFADTHTRVGIQPYWGLSVLLPEAVGVRNAKYMSATGNFVGAEQAMTMGLVTCVVAHEELLSTAMGVAREIVSNDAEALHVLMAGYEETIGLSQDAAMKAEQRRAIAWQTWHYDASTMAQKRQALTKRGSSKVAANEISDEIRKSSP